MSIKSQSEFNKLRVIGKIVRRALDTMTLAARPGVTTAELDRIGATVLSEHGAESAPPKIYGFPGAICISIIAASARAFRGTALSNPATFSNSIW